MALFKNEAGILEKVKEVPFALEKEIQRLFEGNLDKIMGLQFVRSEFPVKDKRIDTLAYDLESNSFIIIEYKRDRSTSVIDQGFSYLSLMLENRADFILEYNEVFNSTTLKRDDVDWSQSKVVFVSTHFTPNQIQATNFKDLAIELWEVKQYSNNSILISQIKKSSGAESIKPLTKQNEVLNKIASEIKVYTEESHYEGISEPIIELYEKFKNSILNLGDNISIAPLKHYIGFRVNKNIADILIQKSQLKIWINLKKGQLDDPKNLTKDMSNTGHLGNGDYELIVKDDSNLEYIMSLVKQSYRAKI